MLVLCPNCGTPVIQYNPHCTRHFAPQPEQPIVRDLGQNSKKEEERDAAEKRNMLLLSRPSLEDLTRVMTQVTRITEYELRQGKERLYRDLTVARRLFIYIAVVEFKYKRKEIALYLNLSLPSLSSHIKKMLTTLSQVGKGQQMYQKVMRLLASHATAEEEHKQTPDA